ncbi:hypothetical protein [Maritimibacter sp. UBA3975]|uniref:hypothetical protein n=1 Tax=Maritimibacter sp. UBA3975 TaxID=1946833 RepID=UPI000C0986C5|nr:hypothetical protein [Maritimibacter sp. UBA3975]MAM62587.1 hypothetical protein [Maritimibacter sp.]|tara:strand:- start:1490 stop:1942 length:453 start_codon:yes stop_codon:yes gene_type:complete
MPARLATALTLAFAAPALAQEQTPLTETNISPMTVIVTDMTEDDCWTDPGAAADIARAELGKTTIELVETEAEAETAFVIAVQARRAEAGCYGSVRLAVGAMIDWKDNGEVAGTLQAVSNIFEGRETVDEFVADGLAQSIPALADYLPDT